MYRILKIILALISCGIFTFVVFNIPYPETLTRANLFQLFSFFIPLFFALIFSLNIFLKILHSILISFGIIILLILKALDSLNLVSALLTIVAIGLLISYSRKSHNPSTHSTRSGSIDLTSGSNIPKLKRLGRKR